MSSNVTIHCLNNGTYADFPKGTNLKTILETLKIETGHTIVSAKVNNKVEDLNFEIYYNKNIEFLDITSKSGMRTYLRSLCFILAKAVADVFPNERLNLEHPVSKGYFCKFQQRDLIDQESVEKIKDRMQELIDADLPFISKEEETVKVVQMFRQRGFHDKALLLETSGELYSKYYSLNGTAVDYFYGSLVPSTGYIRLFDLQPYQNGLLLRTPGTSNPSKLMPYVEQPKMFQVYKDQLEFLNVIGLDNVGDLNKANMEGRMSDIIKVSEAWQEKIIGETAILIAKRFKENGTRIVLISGPSSSGKTTSRMRLEVQLMVNLLKPVGLSLDNYFVERENTPRDEKGDYDYESLYALDLELFNDDLEKLLKGEKVQLPTYNFATGKREYNGNELQIDEHSILIIEGIHGLNPDLTPHIPANQKFMIYVSALTSISLDDHNWIPPSDNRLLRRLVRDYNFRSYSAIDTLSRWPSVRAGEEKWIFPYQENADVMFNSAMLYELAALRQYAEPILSQVPNNAPEYSEAYRLLKFLRYFIPISDKELPPTSLLREFVGGSSFRY